MEQKNAVITSTKERLEERETHLKHKKADLDAILAETEKEEKLLLAKSDDYKKNIEERLVKAYTKIRTNVKNGLAIVPIERGASGDLTLQSHHKCKWKLLLVKKSSQMNTVVEF